MNVFRRLFKIGEAETHSAIDKLEDPIKMTEQGIRDLKKDLDESIKALAEVKALAIRTKNDVTSHKNSAEEYENKAILLLKKAKGGDLAQDEADRLATEALNKKEDFVRSLNRARTEQERYDNNVSQLDVKIKKLRADISAYENELRTLKARVKVSEATGKINKQMAQIDSSSTVSMLERMKEKVAQQEALSDAYGEIANESRSLDDEIDSAIDSSKGAESLEALKTKLGMSDKK